MMLTFKRGRIEDLEEIVAIYNQAIRRKNITADLNEVTVTDKTPWFESYNDNYPLWVILVDNKIAGWVALEPFYGRVAYHKTAELSLYLKEGYQGLGLGSKAVDFVYHQLESLEKTTLVTYIFKSNTPSLHLFEKKGFDHWGYLPDVAEIDGRRESLMILGKKF